jgi:hypothetical protein
MLTLQPGLRKPQERQIAFGLRIVATAGRD